MSSHNVHETCHTITVPTILVHGWKDADVPVEQSIKTAELMPNCTLHVIDSADHWFKWPWESDKANKYFIDFIVEQV